MDFDLKILRFAFDYKLQDAKFLVNDKKRIFGISRRFMIFEGDK